MVWPLMTQGNLYFGDSILICGKSLNVQKNLEFLLWKSVTADSSLLSPTGGVKGMYLHLIFTNIWLRHIDMNNLNHIANNGTDTTKHTDVYNAQFWARRAPSVDAQCLTSHLWLKVSPCVSFHVIHACALVSCLLSGLSSPVFLLPHPAPLPALPDVQLGAWWDLHWRSPVQLQLGEHGHSGLCHTPHTCSYFESQSFRQLDLSVKVGAGRGDIGLEYKISSVLRDITVTMHVDGRVIWRMIAFDRVWKNLSPVRRARPISNPIYCILINCPPLFVCSMPGLC